MRLSTSTNIFAVNRTGPLTDIIECIDLLGYITKSLISELCTIIIHLDYVKFVQYIKRIVQNNMILI